jgi:ubiquinone/menaquinone biosynthesis C-methylase UbiE
MTDIKTSYDSIAGEYADEYFKELESKPDDCKLLDEFANAVRGKGKTCEIGCGPGQVARYLKDCGVDIHGLDLSEEMVNAATELNPDIKFLAANMLSLPHADNSLAGIISFYAVIHLRRPQMVEALKEMQRVLKPSGRLLISFHDGEGELHREEWYGKPVSVPVTLMTAIEMSDYAESAGLKVDRNVKRPPYDFEYPTTRNYLFARKL